MTSPEPTLEAIRALPKVALHDHRRRAEPAVEVVVQRHLRQRADRLGSGFR